MRLLATIRLRLRSVFRGRLVEQELHEELRGHLERQIELHLAAGMSAADARAAALREFGNVSLTQERCRDTRKMGWVEDVLRDAGYAVRSMRRTPGHSAVAALSLACAIGANTAIFSVVNALLLRGLPVADAHQLVEIGRETTSGPGNFSYPLFERVRDENTAFSGVVAMSSPTMTAQLDGMDRDAIGRYVSGDFFEVLGLRPALGRLLTPEDDRDTASRGTVAVIAYGVWQRSFGGDPAVVGSTLRITRFGAAPLPFTIVGVLPRTFDGLIVGRPDDFYVPMAAEPLISPRSLLNADSAGWLKVVGRLKRDVSREAARVELDVIYGRYVDDASAFLSAPLVRGMRASRLAVESARAGLAAPRQQFARPVVLLMGAVALVLLIACANVVNLLLARAIARRGEIAIRQALGASRRRVVRQLLTESAVLGLLGGSIGLAFALWSTPHIGALMSNGDPTVAFDVAPDSRVLVFTLGISLGAAVLAGVIPAYRLPWTAAPHLRDDVRALRATRTMTIWSRGLIASQVALSLLLLAGALLLATSLRHLRTFDFGFDPEHVVMMRLETARAGYTGDRRLAYFRQVLERARRTPGVRSAALSMGMPVVSSGVDTSIGIEGRPVEPGAQAFVNEVSDGYFATTGTRLLSGRDFGPDDRPGSTPVAIVNDAFVRRHFANVSPIGQRITVGRRGVLEIVGVVATTKYESLREDDSPIVYPHAFQRSEMGGFMLSLKTEADPMLLAAAIRRELQSLGPVAVSQPVTLTAQIDRTLVRERLVASVLGAFAALALLLAAVGLYGVLAYTVTRRTNEIGVRLALGATRRAVLVPVLTESSTVVLLGILIGVPAALALTRLLSSLLYGVTPTDGWVLGGVVLSLFAVGLAAASVPAWRASRVNPLDALRYE